ncbi:MAG TPA: hypothetical protein VGG45_20375 [Terracidiphilus sp.]|jgi:hypothetical protein
MKSSGIGEKVIIQQVETNGIAFEADPSALIALRKVGFSDSLLSAVMQSKHSQGAVATPPTAASSAVVQPAQTPADPCDAYEKEYKRINDEEMRSLARARIWLNKDPTTHILWIIAKHKTTQPFATLSTVIS